jgi:hypothetical protein
MAAAKQNPIYVNQLNQRLIEIVNNEGSIELSELSKEYPKFAVVPADALWYSVNSLAEDGYVRLEYVDGALILHSVEQ